MIEISKLHFWISGKILRKFWCDTFLCVFGKPELLPSQQLNLEFFVDASLFGMPQGFEKYMKLTLTLEKNVDPD